MNQQIAKNPTILHESYTPPVLVGRSDQRAQLQHAFSDALAGGEPVRVHVHGPGGSGKSTLVRSTLAGHAAVVVVHVDCVKASTAYRALANAANHLTPSLVDRVPFTGLPVREVVDRLRGAVAAQDRPVVVVLDGIDALDVGDLGLVLEALRPTRASVILVSGTTSLAPVESMVGSLGAREVHVPAFTRGELREVLLSRTEAALHPDAFPSGGLDALLSFVPDHNARAAMTLLRSVVESAASRSASRISVDLVVEAHRTLAYRQAMSAIAGLDANTRRVLDAVLHATQETESVVTGDAYIAYEKLVRPPEHPLTMRRFTDLLQILHDRGLITAQVTSRGRHGRTKTIRPHPGTRQAVSLHPATAPTPRSASA